MTDDAIAHLVTACRLSLRNVEALILMLRADADPVECQSLETWRDLLRAALDKVS